MRIDWIEGRLKKSPLSSNDKQQIALAYADIFKKEMAGNCENCYHDALFEIYLNLRPMTSKYKLKSGIAFRYKEKVYSHLNITDEAAKWYLKQSKENEKHFSLIPTIENKKVSYNEAEK